jgi:hypothetical protein
MEGSSPHEHLCKPRLRKAAGTLGVSRKIKATLKAKLIEIQSV